MGSPAVVNVVVYINSHAFGLLYQFDAQIGKEIWIAHSDNNDPFFSSLTVYNGTIYAIKYRTTPGYVELWAFDAKTGEKGWEISMRGTNISLPTVADGVVYTVISPPGLTSTKL